MKRVGIGDADVDGGEARTIRVPVTRTGGRDALEWEGMDMLEAKEAGWTFWRIRDRYVSTLVCLDDSFSLLTSSKSEAKRCM